MTAVTAEARSNIALIKYWGKRDPDLNLPAAGSLSLTLDGLVTRTTVAFGAGADAFFLDGREAGPEARHRVTRLLDLVRARAGGLGGARVVSENNFPTASGLASSASGFAALALAATRAAGLSLSEHELSALARQGSGSAARSIFGGFAEMKPGTRSDGADAHAVGLLPPDAWDVRLVVAVVAGGEKKDLSSRSGMEHTASTSPLFRGFLDTVPADLEAARAAVLARDLEALGTVAEASALCMHASALAARPGVVYWRGPTIECIHRVRALRRAGTPAWFTIDAGPHVKALTDAGSAGGVAEALAAVPGVTRTHVLRPGVGARVVSS